MKLKLLILVLLMACAAWLFSWCERGWMRTNLVPKPAYVMGKPADEYPTSLQQIRSQRKQWQAQKTPVAQLSAPFTRLFRDQVLAYWYGTPWDFYGTSEKPQQGTIACGYFVTTTLRDMGVSLDRSRLAQLPSEAMIDELVQPSQKFNLSRRGLVRLDTDFRRLGSGVYVIGLDTHTGFIIVDDAGAHFIHASGAFPYRVVNEPVLESSVLEHSQYRVVGKITADMGFMQRWLNAK